MVEAVQQALRVNLYTRVQDHINSNIAWSYWSTENSQTRKVYTRVWVVYVEWSHNNVTPRSNNMHRRLVSLTTGWFTLGSMTKEMYPKLEWSNWLRAKFLIQGVYASWVRVHGMRRWGGTTVPPLSCQNVGGLNPRKYSWWFENPIYDLGTQSWVQKWGPIKEVFWTWTPMYTLSESNISLNRDQQKFPRKWCHISATLDFLIFWTRALMWTPWIQKFILKK